ncbi:M1 family metallopeptidase [Haliangium sp.]|uniref:M1 family metallopeptidase n=1 Tax=Haliangium sp. TaxID=2663208 RepID=UPI003D0F2011
MLVLGDAVVPERYQLELELDPGADTFAGEVAIELSVTEPVTHLWLNATDLSVDSAALVVADERLSLSLVDTDSPEVIGFHLPRALAPGVASLHIEYHGRVSSTDSSGVFRRRDRDRDYVYTQFEPLSARRAFPCFDEPRFKVPWQLTIHVPEGVVAVTNAPLLEEQAGPRPGTRSFAFAATKPMPSYLVAFAVGPFEFVDLGQVGRGHIPARIVVPHGRVSESRYAAAVTPRLLTLLEEYFDMAYPYAKLDSIAIPHFRGAMEHPGLITYSDDLLLAAPEHETVDVRRDYARVGLHELAHQWFGNLVTMRWWDDLWLNESFATWMAARTLPVFEPDWGGAVDALERTDETMDADSLVSARRIRQPITSRHDIDSAFDAISYGKGSAVITMFERRIGEDAFRAAVRAYLRDHAWGSATAGDFLAAVAAVAEPAQAEAMQGFIEQTGVPLVSVALSCEDGAPPTLRLSQQHLVPVGSAAGDERRWHVPVCAVYGDGDEVRRQCTTLSESEAEVVLDQARRCPRWLHANAGATGYYRVIYPPELLRALLGPARRRLSELERVQVATELRALSRAGVIEMATVLELIPTLVRDPSAYVTQVAVDLTADLRQHLVPPGLEAHYRRFVRKTFGARARALGWQPRAGETEAERRLRAPLLSLVAGDGGDRVLVRQARRLAERWLDRGQGTADEMLETVLAVAVRHGARALHERVEQALLGTADPRLRRILVAALAHAPQPARIDDNLALALSGQVDIRDAQDLFQVPLNRAESRTQIMDFLYQRYDGLLARIPRWRRRDLIEAAGSGCDPSARERAQAFFGPKVDQIPGGPRALAQALERIELCAAAQAIHQPGVEAFLRAQ